MQLTQTNEQLLNQEDTLGNDPSDTEQYNIRFLKSLNNQRARLVVTYQGEAKEFKPGPHIFTMGRGQDCDIVVSDRLSSRKHAHFVYRKGKFVLIDHSTNGTFVRSNGPTEICLVEQEQLPLTGSGIIGLGKSTYKEKDQLIYFSCCYDKRDSTHSD
jgi:hypothetical protein